MNRRQLLGLPAILLGAACGEQPALGYDGMAGVAWGTPLSEARVHLGQPLAVESNAESGCTYTTATVAGRPVALMVVDGRVVRADVTSDSSLAAPGGGRIGALAPDLLQVYGERLRRLPHKYTDGQYFIVPSPADSMRRVVFEIAGGRVSQWRIGLLPPVEYVEGCS